MSCSSIQTPKASLGKNHFCDWPGCGKGFTRAEHLRRHALNHRSSGTTWRHMARHAKRDEEAGGPGLGVLETRKRTRRGPDGETYQETI
ncbi:hypothetical protein VTO42DRAFT_646 [Malbranchea cinnamomea]